MVLFGALATGRCASSTPHAKAPMVRSATVGTGIPGYVYIGSMGPTPTNSYGASSGHTSPTGIEPPQPADVAHNPVHY
jgi:hypothetical protein